MVLMAGWSLEVGLEAFGQGGYLKGLVLRTDTQSFSWFHCWFIYFSLFLFLATVSRGRVVICVLHGVNTVCRNGSLGQGSRTTQNWEVKAYIISLFLFSFPLFGYVCFGKAGASSWKGGTHCDVYT